VDSLLSALWGSPTFDPPTGTLQALINSGDIDVLADPELVGALTAWPAFVEDLKENEDLAADHDLQVPP
jgi:hypothetical protein